MKKLNYRIELPKKHKIDHQELIIAAKDTWRAKGYILVFVLKIHHHKLIPRNLST